MAEITASSATLGNSLQELLMAPELAPGDEASYQVCKTIYEYHPLGAKIADNPIAMAQSQERKITVQKGPEERLVEAFVKEWKAIGADRHIFNIARLSRVYGIASIALIIDGQDTKSQLDFSTLADAKIGFNALDPLNTSGSLVLNQDPNSIDFQKVGEIAVSGKAYHRSRTITLMNEDPLYIAYTTSAFGYVGRSVYQRALFPLKSFINTQITNDMVAAKAGLLVVKEKQQSSAIDALMAAVASVKRTLLKIGQVGQILQIGADDTVESLNLQNLEGPLGLARKNILEDIASSAGTPAQIINSETFAEGFGEGTEDAKRVAQYIQRIRIWLGPAYDYFTKIVQHRAWNADLHASLLKEFPGLVADDYKAAFYDWADSFRADWPSLIEEPDSEKVKVDEVKLKAIIAYLEVLLPEMDPENRSILVRWACENANAMKLLFSSPLNLDYDALEDYDPGVNSDSLDEEPGPGRPFSAMDSATLLGVLKARRRRIGSAVGALEDSVRRLADDRAAA